jgi:hypothetical protein
MTFKFLEAVTAEMARLGADLWSEEAVATLKHHLVENIAKLAEQTITQLSHIDSSMPTANGVGVHAKDRDGDVEVDGKVDAAVNSDTDSSTEIQVRREQLLKEKLMQLVMDLDYLSVALSTRTQDRTQLHQLVEHAAIRAELNDDDKARLQKSAIDYWKRTYLLFALLTHAR